MNRSLFLCYARRDEKLVREVVAILRWRGAEVWLDLEAIEHFEDPWPEVQLGLAHARGLVWVSRPDTPMTRWVALELSEAKRRGMPIACIDLGHPDEYEVQVSFVLDQIGGVADAP